MHAAQLVHHDRRTRVRSISIALCERYLIFVFVVTLAKEKRKHRRESYRILILLRYLRPNEQLVYPTVRRSRRRRNLLLPRRINAP